MGEYGKRLECRFWARHHTGSDSILHLCTDTTTPSTIWTLRQSQSGALVCMLDALRCKQTTVASQVMSSLPLHRFPNTPLDLTLLRTSFETAVEKRLMSDVPFGV